ncbi:Tyrosine recombinase XerC [subsurface metagenome]
MTATYAALLTALRDDRCHLGLKDLEGIEEILEGLRPGVTITVEESGIIRFEESGRRPSQPPPGTQEAVAAYLIRMEDGGAAEGYVKVRARKLRYFARQHPQLPTDPETIHAYLRQFKTANVPTRQDVWKALSALYKFASDAYGMVNPMLKIEKPRFKKKPGQRLSRDQARRFLSVVETDLEWAAVTCYFGLRFRRIEAERLRVGDIKSDYLIVQGKERTEELPLLPLLREKLLKLSKDHRSNRPLFPIKADTLAYHIKQLFKRAGIGDVRGSPHTLRNTAGRLWLTYGGDDRANRQLLRHGNRTMTDHYSELNIDELYALEERFNPMLNLLRELPPTLTNTTGVLVSEADPARLLPQLLDQMAALGEMAHELSQALGGNGHRVEQIEGIARFLEHQAKSRLGVSALERRD